MARDVSSDLINAREVPRNKVSSCFCFPFRFSMSSFPGWKNKKADQKNGQVPSFMVASALMDKEINVGEQEPKRSRFSAKLPSFGGVLGWRNRKGKSVPAPEHESKTQEA